MEAGYKNPATMVPGTLKCQNSPDNFAIILCYLLFWASIVTTTKTPANGKFEIKFIAENELNLA